jgi:hypothetical protein
VQRAPSGGIAPGFLVHSIATQRNERVLERGFSPQWLPDSRHVVFFEKQTVGIVDIDGGRVTTAPVKPLPGVRLDDITLYPRISSDGSTLYLRQVLEQGDIWMVRMAKE